MRHHRNRRSLSIVCLFITSIASVTLVISSFAHPLSTQKPFNKSEFVTRREKLFEKIPDGIAVIPAAGRQIYPIRFRQAPDFYYLTGIEEANAILLLVGPNKSSYVFVTKRPEAWVRAEGPGIWELDKREEFYGLTAVRPSEEFLPTLTWLSQKAKKLYLLSSSQGNVQNAREELDFHEMTAMSHPLFRNVPESRQAINVIKQVVPQLMLQDLNPLLDEMRLIKTPYEVELMRTSCKIGAEGVKEAIKGTRPGMYEYELEAVARYVIQSSVRAATPLRRSLLRDQTR